MAQQKVTQETVVKEYGYDEDAVVEAIARGAKTYTEIAEEHGVTRQCISQIARGRRRGDLHHEIMVMQESYLLQARRLAVACAVQMMAAHIREGLEGTGETARKCREYVINRVLGEPGEPAPMLPRARSAEFDVDAIVSRYDGPTESDSGEMTREDYVPKRFPEDYKREIWEQHASWLSEFKTPGLAERIVEELYAASMAEDAEEELRERKFRGMSAPAGREAGERAEEGGGVRGAGGKHDGKDKGKDKGNDAERQAGGKRWEEGKGKDKGNDAKRQANGRRVHVAPSTTRGGNGGKAPG